MIYNTETKRLEFEDGTPVGAVPLNDALVARGHRARKAHLQETQECKERRIEEAAQGAKRMVRKRDRKNLFQKGHGDFVKARQPAVAFGGVDMFGRGYTAGLRAVAWVED